MILGLFGVKIYLVIKMNKLYYVFDIATPLHFVYCGKASFQTNYIHDRRIMKDYEIFIVTSGKLYMEQNNYQAEITPKQICFNLPHIVHFFKILINLLVPSRSAPNSTNFSAS